MKESGELCTNTGLFLNVFMPPGRPWMWVSYEKDHKDTCNSNFIYCLRL